MVSLKRIISLLIFALLAGQIYSQSIDELTELMSEEVFKKLKKVPIPVQSKITVCFFIGEQGAYDDLHTKLGIKLANEFAITLKREFQKKKRLDNIEILLNDKVGKVLNAEMQGSFIPPDNTKDEEKFWKQLKNNERPDYFISGKYEVIGDFNGIRLKNMRLEKNKFNTDFNDRSYRPPVFDDVDVLIQSQKEKEKLRIWNTPIKNIPEVYAQFMSLQSTKSDITIDILDGNNGEVLPPSTPLKLNTDYQFRLNLNEKAHVYAFYYESDDLLGLHMFMLYPISRNEKNFYEQGQIILPKIGDQEFMFVPSPPISGQVLIKIVASKHELALHYTETDDGYLYLNEKQCAQFYNQLKSLNSSDYQIVTLVKDIDE